METDIHRESVSHRRVEHWLLVAALLAAVIAVVLWWRISNREDMSFSNDPRFVITTAPNISFSTPSATFPQRILIWWLRLERSFQKSHSAIGSFTFPASPRNRCLIQGLLNQCTAVNGVRYVIAKDVAAGTVMFGHTNTLTGKQWVLAFTEALQHGQPEFRDSQTKTFRRENLVLLTNSPRTVLVLPKSMVAGFQKQTTNRSGN